MPDAPEPPSDPAQGEHAGSSSSSDVLVARGITKRWPRLEHPVLDELSLTLSRGSCQRIMGDNGAGKTTLMRVIGGLVEPEAGTVLVDGRDPLRDREAAQRRIGFLSAGDRGLYARLTVRQHLELWSRLALLGGDRRAQAVQRAGADFELSSLEGGRADRLSMGQRQRLRVAMTFLHEPQLVLLDEPMNSLDDAAAQLLGRGIERTVARGGCCLWISPGSDQAPVAFERTFVLRRGRLEPA